MRERPFHPSYENLVNRKKAHECKKQDKPEAESDKYKVATAVPARSRAGIMPGLTHSPSQQPCWDHERKLRQIFQSELTRWPRNRNPLKVVQVHRRHRGTLISVAESKTGEHKATPPPRVCKAPWLGFPFVSSSVASHLTCLCMPPSLSPLRRLASSAYSSAFTWSQKHPCPKCLIPSCSKALLLTTTWYKFLEEKSDWDSSLVQPDSTWLAVCAGCLWSLSLVQLVWRHTVLRATPRSYKWDKHCETRLSSGKPGW